MGRIAEPVGAKACRIWRLCLLAFSEKPRGPMGFPIGPLGVKSKAR